MSLPHFPATGQGLGEAGGDNRTPRDWAVAKGFEHMRAAEIPACATMADMNENIYKQLYEHEQAKLDAAGLCDVKFVIGWFRTGDHLRLEARVSGPPASQNKARQLLSFSDAE